MEQTSDNQIEQRRKEIWEEVKSWKEKEYEEDFSWHGKLNNFVDYLPNPRYEHGSSMGNKYGIIGWLDKKNGATHKESASWHSELFLSQTGREFLETIKEAAENTPNFNLEESIRLHDKELAVKARAYKKGMPTEEEKLWREEIEEAGKVQRELYDYVVTLYVELRAKGYSHFDLTG